MFLTDSALLDQFFLTAAIILAAFLIFRLCRFFLRRFLLKSSEHMRVDPTNYTFLNNALSLIIFMVTVIVVLYSIPEFKKVGITLFASAGVFAAIVGFASQAAFSNIISGIFIVIFKPFRVGDIVKAQDKYGGIIEDITLRHVVIRDFENRRYVIPNSIVSNDVIHNSSLYEEQTANFIFVSISYDSDLDKAIDLLREEALKHPLLLDMRSVEEKEKDDYIVSIRVVKLNEYSVDLRATCWTKNFIDGFELKTDLLRSIKLRYDKEGIEIPFPHRTVVQKQRGQII